MSQIAAVKANEANKTTNRPSLTGKEAKEHANTTDEQPAEIHKLRKLRLPRLRVNGLQFFKDIAGGHEQRQSITIRLFEKLLQDIDQLDLLRRHINRQGIAHIALHAPKGGFQYIAACPLPCF